MRGTQGAPWKVSEVKILRERIGREPVEVLAARLGRTPAAVKAYAHKMGLRVGYANREVSRHYVPPHPPATRAAALSMVAAGMSYAAAGRAVGVSDTRVRKWALAA